LDTTDLQGNFIDEAASFEPLVPSTHFYCPSTTDTYITLRSELNYRFLWMHTEDLTMSASATMDTPVHRKAFKLTHTDSSCASGWMLMQPADSSSFIYMLSPNRSVDGYYDKDTWKLKPGTDQVDVAIQDPAYHFLVEEEGYLVNKDCNACVNVMPTQEYIVVGHSSGWNTHYPSGREFSAMLHYDVIGSDNVHASLQKEKEEEEQVKELDKQLVEKIKNFPKSSEKRVISFGLYGSKDKYTMGAIRNLELAAVYFPGMFPYIKCYVSISYFVLYIFV
jgi:hypothetical protein